MEYGAPYEIFSDRDKAFLESALPHYERFLKIKHYATTAYHPRTNGMVERMHRTLNHGIRTMAQEHMDRWDEYLAQVVFGLRVRTHSVTKHSPFFLVHGVPPRLPMDTLPPRSVMQPMDEIEKMEEQHEFIARTFEELGLARRAATERTKAQAQAMRKRNADLFNGDETSHKYDIGDWVKLRMKKHSKWDKQFTGPYMVVKQHFPHTYFIMNFNGEWLPDPINEERLSLWKGNIGDCVNPNDKTIFDDVVEELRENNDPEDEITEGEDNLLA